MEAFPAVLAELPVSLVQEMSQSEIPGLGTIYLAELRIETQLDSVTVTTRAASAWNQNTTGDGVTVGVIEAGIIRPDIQHLSLQGKVVAFNVNEPDNAHAARVASIIAGNPSGHEQYRGIAYNSAIASAKAVSDWLSISSGLNWLISQQAYVINASFATNGTLSFQAEDRAIDYIVRYNDPTIVVSAGNNVGDAFGANVRSPAKAYNVIAVGGFTDNDTGSWTDDQVWPLSAYIDPYIDGQNTAGDREKPEVAAVAVVTSADIDQGPLGFSTSQGTSLAAPQVSGLVALLFNRYYWLRTNPEAVKAIIMASALHNIEGDQRLSEKDGAGGIDIATAMNIFDGYGGWDYRIIRNITDGTDSNNPFRDGSEEYPGSGFVVGNTFAESGNLVRAVICWSSNPSASYTTNGGDALSTDFDLRVVSPDDSIVATSTSFHNNYEIVQFTAPKTGHYKLRITYYARTPAEGLDLGLGMAWVRQPRVYIPLTMKNYSPNQPDPPAGYP